MRRNTKRLSGDTLPDFQGKAANIVSLKRDCAKMALSDADILITGESGTGKEVLAQSIHNASLRASNRFVAINCATLDGNLITSELFGYTSGTFTGANQEGWQLSLRRPKSKF